MATRLIYPRIPDGYRWNLLMKIFYRIGKKPGTHSDADITELHWHNDDLSGPEIIAVNEIMAEPNPCDPIDFQTIGNKFIIKDVYEWKDQVEADCGFPVAVTYRVSGLKGDEPDEIVVQPTDPTYQNEKLMQGPDEGRLRTALKNLIQVE